MLFEYYTFVSDGSSCFLSDPKLPLKQRDTDCLSNHSGHLENIKKLNGPSVFEVNQNFIDFHKLIQCDGMNGDNQSQKHKNKYYGH